MECRWFKRIFVFLVLVCLWNIKQQQQQQVLPVSGVSMPAKEILVGWQFSTPFPVDLVYTWVNGSDPRLQEDVERLKQQLQRTKSFSATKAKNLASHRFADNGALKFSLRSVEKNANWIRHVFIVTNGQIPNWLNLQNPRVSIVKHKEIFDDSECLPTFASAAIEHNIHKIKGLSERFIYMNDDFFFGRKVSLTDFYTEDKGTKVYLIQKAPTKCSKKCNMTLIKNGVCDDVCNYDHCVWDGGDCSDIPVQKRPSDLDKAYCVHTATIFYTNAIYNRAFGYKERRIVTHAPLFMEKRVKQDLDRRFPTEVYETIHRKLRSPLNLQFQFSYMHFLMEAYNRSYRFEPKVYSRNVAFTRVSISLNKTRKTIGKLWKTKRKFICINDAIDYNHPKDAKKIIDLLGEFYKSMFPNTSSFEKHS